MKKLILASAALVSVSANAKDLNGSDTLLGLMKDAIVEAGLEDELAYVGGGSSTGAKALIAETQGVTAMSRALKDSEREALAAAGHEVIEVPVALDAVQIFVNGANVTANISQEDIFNIFTCKVTAWEDVEGSGQTGEIVVYRRDDLSGTTDTFKSLALKPFGTKNFGDCVTSLPSTEEIAARTATEAGSIGFSGRSGNVEGNKALNVGGFEPSNENVRAEVSIKGSGYPLSRALFVYGIESLQTDAELELFDLLQDDEAMAEIVVNNEFITK